MFHKLLVVFHNNKTSQSLQNALPPGESVTRPIHNRRSVPLKSSPVKTKHSEHVL